MTEPAPAVKPMSMVVDSELYCHGVFEIGVLDCHAVGAEQWFSLRMSTRPEPTPRDGISLEVKWLTKEYGQRRHKKILGSNPEGVGMKIIEIHRGGSW
jgi:hypothetical protein